MRLLVTRAEPGASASAERLRRLGHSTIVAPMLRIEDLPPPRDLEDPAAIVLTSANGARALSAWPAAARWRDVPVFAVGAVTAETCRAAGFNNVGAGDGGVDALYARIVAELPPGAGLVLCAAAETPAGDLAARLAGAGYAVARVSAYRAVPAAALPAEAHRALAGRTLDAVLFYSERGSATFAELVAAAALGDSVRGLDFVAISRDAARPLARLAPRRIVVADRPNEEALIASLSRKSEPPGSPSPSQSLL